jgi:hypothetical protein
MPLRSGATSQQTAPAGAMPHLRLLKTWRKNAKHVHNHVEDTNIPKQHKQVL